MCSRQWASIAWGSMVTPARGTTNATVSSSPRSFRLPTTAASSTDGWVTSVDSTSAGDTQMPPALIMSLLRPRNVHASDSERTYTSPVRSQPPSRNAAAVASGRCQYPNAVEGPRTCRYPGVSQSVISTSSSPSNFTSYPGTGQPDDPAACAASVLDTKMCKASVEPMPSSTGWPNRSEKRRCRSAGSDSPAVTVARTDANASAGTGVSSTAATNPGAAKNSVGCSAATSAHMLPGVGRCGSRIVVAPAPKGNVSELPSPYAKNNLATDKNRSSGPTFNTSVA